MPHPDGKTCADCIHWKRCSWLIDDMNETDTECDWDPSKFKAKTPKFNQGDIALYAGERVTIEKVRQTSQKHFMYDVKEHPTTFIFEHELKAVSK